MKILYLCHRYPYPPTRGGKIMPFNQIKHLGEQGHQVTVCTLLRNEEEEADAAQPPGLAAYCHALHAVRVHEPIQILRMIARLPTRIPSSMGYFYSPELAAKVRFFLANDKWDLIFVHCSSMAQYVAHVEGIPKLLDFCDMDSQKWLAYSLAKPWPLWVGYRIEGAKLQNEEKRLARQFDLCTVTTRAELKTLDGYRTGTATDWFPHGVDSDYFNPEDPDHAGYEPETLSFIGRMDYYPNQQAMRRFCADVWPLLRQRRPALKLLIVGANPSPAVRCLAQLPGITVTGSVPDVRPWVRRSALMVAPLTIARGTQNKILESMSLGVPVLTTRKAAAGVDAEPGRDLLVADGVEEMVAAVESVLADPKERRRLAVAGRERVLSHHGWAVGMGRMEGCVGRCFEIGARTAAAAGPPR